MSALKIKYKNPDLEEGLEVSVADIALLTNGGDYVDVSEQLQAQYKATHGVELLDGLKENPCVSIRGEKKEDLTPNEERSRNPEASPVVADVVAATEAATEGGES